MALDAGKHVFVEKPLCLTHEELLELEEESYESLKKGGIVPLYGEDLIDALPSSLKN